MWYGGTLLFHGKASAVLLQVYLESVLVYAVQTLCRGFCLHQTDTDRPGRRRTDAVARPDRHAADPMLLFWARCPNYTVV